MKDTLWEIREYLTTRWARLVCHFKGHQWMTVQSGSWEPDPVDECQRCDNKTDGPL